MRAACFGTGPIDPFSTVESYDQNLAMPGMSGWHCEGSFHDSETLQVPRAGHEKERISSSFSAQGSHGAFDGGYCGYRGVFADR
jgi:hypothetical protein